VGEAPKKQMGSGYFHQVGSVPGGCRYHSSSKNQETRSLTGRKRNGVLEETKKQVRFSAKQET